MRPAPQRGMSARREAREAAKEAKDAVAAEKATAKEYVDAALREYKPRKGGTAKWKKGSKVLVPHTDQVRDGMCVGESPRGQAGCGACGI